MFFRKKKKQNKGWAELPITWGTDNDNVMHTHNTILFSYEEKWRSWDMAQQLNRVYCIYRGPECDPQYLCQTAYPVNPAPENWMTPLDSKGTRTHTLMCMHTQLKQAFKKKNKICRKMKLEMLYWMRSPRSRRLQFSDVFNLVVSGQMRKLKWTWGWGLKEREQWKTQNTENRKNTGVKRVKCEWKRGGVG